MNGIHDLGGMHGFGSVERQPAEPPFEFDWVPAVIAMQSATVPAVANIDEFRYAIERMDPLHYLGSSYFEHWLDGITRYCLEKGVAAAEELDARVEAFEAAADEPLPSLRDPSAWPSRKRAGHPHRRVAGGPPRFALGARVRTNRDQPAGHTRLPRYARGCSGTVEGYLGCFVFPDAAAAGRDEPAHLYSVVFEAGELWGATAEPGSSVAIDLFEPYLEVVG